MKRLIFLIAMTATQATAKEPPIVQFNGYSVTVKAGQTEPGAPTEDTVSAAKSRATEACKSAGKTAKLEAREKISGFFYSFFFTCL